jgi:hypothetical protein
LVLGLCILRGLDVRGLGEGCRREEGGGLVCTVQICRYSSEAESSVLAGKMEVRVVYGVQGRVLGL